RGLPCRGRHRSLEGSLTGAADHRVAVAGRNLCEYPSARTAWRADEGRRMISARLVPVAIKKELRALAPGWLACFALFAAAAAVDQGWLRMLRIAAYFLGPTALGALSMGH